MDTQSWTDEFPAAITVTDGSGIILAMNHRSQETFAEDGGATLIGKQVMDCHPEPARTMFAAMLENHSVNAYTIEKQGVKKLVYQAPWYKDGHFEGYVEMSLPIPFKMPHFVRN